MKIPFPVICLIPVLYSLAAMAEYNVRDWREVKNANGIQVYTSGVNDQEILKVKTVAVIEADLASVQAKLENIDHYAEWVPYLSSVQVLHQISVAERLMYSQFTSPWPASNRDFVYRQRIIHDADGVVRYVMRSEESTLMPEQKGYVRAVVIESEYTLTPVSENQTRFEFVFHADPRGYLPVWIINIIQRGFPYVALKQLKHQLESSGAGVERQ